MSSDKKNESSSEIFVDCDPKIFRHILNFIIVPDYIVPDKYAHNVQKMLDYYSPNKFIVNTVQQKSGLTNITFTFPFEKKQKFYSSYLEHDGIVAFYLKFFCAQCSNAEISFKLKLWDIHNSIEINDHNLFCNRNSNELHWEKHRNVIFEIPHSIISIFKKELHIRCDIFQNRIINKN